MNILRLMGKLRYLSPEHRLEWYPPYFFMRIKVLELTDNWGVVRIKLPLNAISKNMGDAMFGGYQASLADSIAALACVRRFPKYDVWSRVLTVEFIRPGNSDLELRFEFDNELYRQITLELAQSGRSNPVFHYGLYRSDGELCTKVSATVAIRPENYLIKKQKKSS